MGDDLGLAVIVCPKCKMKSHHPRDIEFRWCAKCNGFHYAAVPQEPVNLNEIMSDLQASVRGQLGGGAPFSLQFEDVPNGGVRYWRAFIKLGGSVWKTSRRHHTTPTDALRELTEIVEARL